MPLFAAIAADHEPVQRHHDGERCSARANALQRRDPPVKHGVTGWKGIGGGRLKGGRALVVGAYHEGGIGGGLVRPEMTDEADGKMRDGTLVYKHVNLD